MERITSLANERVRWARTLHRSRVRQREGQYLIEGVRLVEEALRVGILPTLVFLSPKVGQTGRGAALVASLEGQPEVRKRVVLVSEEVLQALSDTVTPQGVVAVVPMVVRPLGVPGLILILDGIRDPGNLGTILRACNAAGVEAVLLPLGTVDPYSPKVVRAAMGALFHLPLRARLGWEAIRQQVAGRPVWLAQAGGGERYDQVDWAVPSAVIVGGEAEGASPEAEAVATGRVHIPMEPGVESLNAAVAAGVLLFEARRQREAVGWPRSSS
ncbi:MAG: TrmH family RNA methyltransferase [Anaerolineae bacterium]